MPTVTQFAVDALAVLGCTLSQADTPEGRQALDVWMRFSLAGETDSCIKGLAPGELFTAQNVIVCCRRANPQADIT